MNWKPIELLDKGVTQFVLVHEDGAMRVYLWNHIIQAWERPWPIGSVVKDEDYDMVSSPTHWMELPEPPTEGE